MEQNPNDTRVLYNANCPVCSFEIGHYEAYASQKALPLRFEDLNETDLAPWGLTRDEAARRLYVFKDGKLLSGISAFLAVWQDMPRYRWLARLVDMPVIRPLAERVYDHVLAPLIYRWHLRRTERQQRAEAHARR
ncbi:thiol-disulfide oxidoreductase DCC family protein [Thalassococcus sp. S3]|uniref:thiol-disulfide oxidoreductase DCC family protein n=1 Tax=Thalassococcus sp. S3 TaxID=2017482 RepID=UPI0010248A48|nr:DUF393 domain-containing protein [Thalassococcus sp. S3]QBF30959.1 thiol-disulfide oxidoreductase [Thalassococcus sp. S3]